MRTSDHTKHAPVIAAFSPNSGAREPVEFAIAASRLTGAPLVIIVVADTGSLPVHFGADDAPKLPAGLSDPVKWLEQELQRRGIFAEIRAFEDSTAARGLARAIDELEPELVVIGSTTRGRRGATLLGTTAERVIHVSACPIAIVPHGYERPEGGVKTVGAAYTATPEGEDALRAAASFARTGGTALRVITIIDPDHAQESAHAMMAEQHHELGVEVETAARARVGIEAQARALMAEVAGDIEAELDLMADDPASAIMAASAHVDLLVMGSRGLGPRRAVVLGSVSRKVIGGAACPVVVLPRGSEAKQDELLADAQAHAPGAS
jgi:nucleotide-binding universal stress UspA family protein